MPHDRNNIVDFAHRYRETREQALERLYNEYGEALRAFVLGRTGGDQETEDVVQEVFARLASLEELHEKLPAGRYDNRAYLFTIANNLLVDRERRRIAQSRYDTEQLSKDSHNILEISPESILSAKRELDLMKRVILEMRPTWRQAFVLHRFKYLGYREIAEHMGVSLKQVENFMAQALVRIRKAEQRIRDSESQEGKHNG